VGAADLSGIRGRPAEVPQLWETDENNCFHPGKGGDHPHPAAPQAVADRVSKARSGRSPGFSVQYQPAAEIIRLRKTFRTAGSEVFIFWAKW